MALVTLRILDGPERGAIFNQMVTPVTLGREEGNTIQLNDERISRFHLRITEDHGSVLLTDLQSTNGTRVNGEVVHLWTLRPGDLITIGRSQVLVGSANEIALRLKNLREKDISAAVPMGNEEFQILENVFAVSPPGESASAPFSSSPFEAEIFRDLVDEKFSDLHMLPPPPLPHGLHPVQIAQLAEYLQYIQLRLRYLVMSVTLSKKDDGSVDENSIKLDMHQWQNLLDLYGRIALHLHAITEP